jgi:anti-anti-sigma factor
MINSGSVPAQILASLSPSCVWVRIDGKGTFETSHGLKEFANRVIEEGRNSIVIDLQNCTSLDSTFMGVLAGIAISLTSRPSGSLWVVNCNDKTHGLLTSLGLDALFSSAPLPEHQAAVAETVSTDRPDKATTRQTMIEAHEACVKANPRNESIFRPVLEILKSSAGKSVAPQTPSPSPELAH